MQMQQDAKTIAAVTQGDKVEVSSLAGLIRQRQQD
jgi:hypothetical protein